MRIPRAARRSRRRQGFRRWPRRGAGQDVGPRAEPGAGSSSTRLTLCLSRIVRSRAMSGGWTGGRHGAAKVHRCARPGGGVAPLADLVLPMTDDVAFQSLREEILGAIQELADREHQRRVSY